MKILATSLLVALTLTAAHADDRSDVMRLAGPGDKVHGLRIAGNFALMNVSYKEEGGGQVIARKLDGRWVRIGGGGGAMGPHEFYQMGIPPELWGQLANYKYPRKDVEAELNSGSAWPETNQRVLGENDIGYQSAYELTMMRNEIFARHGMRFKDPLIANYFATRRWYHPSSNFNPNSLTELEKKNAAYIQGLQNRKGKNL